ncbi:capsid protein [Crucivirus-409]|nr:capsid protein [Crucivirus-409]QMW68877.1 capsid protein [Crucivirus-410]
MPKYNFKKAFNGKTNRSYAKQIGQGLASKAIMRRQIGRGLKYVKQQFGGMAPMSSGAISGMGAYKVHHSKRYTVGRGFKPHRGHPHINLEKGAMSITHTEYIGDLLSGSASTPSPFTSQSYGINAANTGLFPWLSGTAVNFQEYKFTKLVIEYRPLVSESSSTTSGALLSMGSVIVATQYNSASGPYANKATMAESDYAVTTKPSEHVLHAVECDVKYNPMGILYVSPQTSVTQGANGTDIRMQNLGIVQISSVGIPNTGTPISLGEIWVHYTVVLMKPQLNAGLSAIESAHYSGNATVGIPTAAAPFGPNTIAIGNATVPNGVQPTADPYNLLSLNFTTNSFSFPLQVTTGQFLCTYYFKSVNAAAITIPAITVAAGTGTKINAFNNGVNYDGVDQSNGPQSALVGTSQYIIQFIVSVNAPGSVLCTVTFGTATNLPAAGLWDLLVTPYNSLMT